MKKYNYFSQEGNRYILKPQTGLSMSMAILFVLGGISMIAFGVFSGLGYFLLALAGLIIYSQNKRQFIIDADKKLFMVKNNAFQPEVTYPFSSFDGITLHRLRYFGLLTINVSAVAYFKMNGEEKVGALNTAFTTAPIQRLINEIDDILEQYGLLANGENDRNGPRF